MWQISHESNTFNELKNSNKIFSVLWVVDKFSLGFSLSLKFVSQFILCKFVSKHKRDDNQKIKKKSKSKTQKNENFFLFSFTNLLTLWVVIEA